jgi:pimeloyl-ACP methyl ester carboxylesterase
MRVEPGIAVELVRLTTTDNHPLDAALITPQTARPDAAILHLHGKGGNFYTGPSRFVPELTKDRPIAHLALNMRCHDLGYTRYGRASPDFMTADVPVAGGFWEKISAGHQDVAAAVEFLRDRGYTRIFISGHSSGGYYAVDYAARDSTVAGLALLSPLTTNRTALARWFSGPGELDDALVRAHELISMGRGNHLIPLRSWYYAISAESLVERVADPEDKWESELARLECPVLLLWGDSESRHELWSAIADRVQLAGLERLILPGAEHHYAGFEQQVARAIAGFVVPQ